MTDSIIVSELDVRRSGNSICSVSQFSVAAEQRTAVIGPNGSGKSTLLRVLAGLETRYNGSIQVNGKCVLVHQKPYLFSGSVLQNITYGDRSTRGFELADQWMEKLKITHLRDRKTKGLSGGETRRIAIARAMVVQPDILLLDEPFAELDEEGRSAVTSALENESLTLIIASPRHIDDMAIENRELFNG